MQDIHIITRCTTETVYLLMNKTIIKSYCVAETNEEKHVFSTKHGPRGMWKITSFVLLIITNCIKYWCTLLQMPTYRCPKQCYIQRRIKDFRLGGSKHWSYMKVNCKYHKYTSTPVYVLGLRRFKQYTYFRQSISPLLSMLGMLSHLGIRK